MEKMLKSSLNEQKLKSSRSSPTKTVKRTWDEAADSSAICDQNDSTGTHSTATKKFKFDKSDVYSKKLNRRLSRLLKWKNKDKQQSKFNKFGKDYFSLCDDHCEVCRKKTNCCDPSVFVAIDCEFVGVGTRKISALGRCSVVDFSGNILCDIYCKPDSPITDYRTRWSGIRPRDLVSAVPFEYAQTQIKNILKGKVVIGHAVHHDFAVLQIFPARQHIIDTSKSQLLIAKVVSEDVPVQHGGVSLKRMASYLLGHDIQTSEHCSVEDSRTCMNLFKLIYAEVNQMDAEFKKKFTKPKKRKIILNMLKKSAINGEEPRNKSFLDDEFWPAFNEDVLDI